MYGIRGGILAYEGQKGEIGVYPDKIDDEEIGVETQANHEEGDDEESPAHCNQDDAGAGSCRRRHGPETPSEVPTVMKVESRSPSLRSSPSIIVAFVICPAVMAG